MKAYDKIRQMKDVEGMNTTGLEITKKIDGSCGRFTVEDGTLVFGQRSSNQEYSDLSNAHAPYNMMYQRIQDKINGLGLGTKMAVKRILEGIVIFGEVSGKHNRHKLDYPWDLQFIVFNGWDKKTEKYLPPTEERIMAIIEYLGLGVVENIGITDYAGAVEWVKVQDPKKVEGFVAKDYEHQLMCKMYVPGNEEIESAKFVKHKGNPCYGESKFLHRYVTRARIEKLLMKIMEGQQQRSFMQHTPALLKMLWNDILFECLPEFLNEERVFREVPASKNEAGEDVKAYREEVIDIGYIRVQMPKLAVGIMKEIACEGKKDEDQTRI